MRNLALALLLLLGVAHATRVHAVEPSRSIDTYVLFAYDELVFKGGSPGVDTGHIHGGNIGVNFPGRSSSGFSLSYATRGQATMDPGTQAVADSVRADDPAGVFFDLFANVVNPTFAATILGTGPTPFTTPIIAAASLPVLPFTPGRALTDSAADVTVGGLGGVPSPFTFTPGAYRDVRVNDGSTVRFGDGVFDIRSLSLGANVTVEVTDATILQIDRTWSMNDGVEFGLGSGSGAQVFLGAFGLNVNTERVTNFAHRYEIHAQVFAPTGWLDLGGDGELFGRFWAQRITGDPGNDVTYVKPGGNPPPGGDLDHFQCYEVHRGPARQSVTLVDALGSSTAALTRAKRFCAPASKNDEDPTAPTHPGHLTFYTLGRFTPAFTRIRDVTVTNQFGTLLVDVVKPDRLLVPTAKSLSGPPAPLATPLDHFNCYKIGGARFRANAIGVEDQFGSIQVDVKRPEHLCVATSKNGEPVPNPQASLLCYSVKLARGTPLNQRPPAVFTLNQFGPDQFQIFGPRDLCVPSTYTLP